MMSVPMTYERFNREQWSHFHGHHQLNTITQGELQQLAALNDRVSLADVQDIYVPLRHLIHLYLKAYEQRFRLQQEFLGHENQKVPPFLIGISGSVAVGKSTTARLLQRLLARAYTGRRVELITTDGFLKPNAQLQQENILNRKGFPESYDMPRLIAFLNDVKSGRRAQAPRYSHQNYDIMQNEVDVIECPDILIVEGINVLQLPARAPIYISDFFDFSLYVDAAPDLIEQWYLERFDLLLDTAFTDPANYYYPYAIGNRQAAREMAREVWRTINLPNLRDYILPTRHRATVILHKVAHHVIDEVALRKY